MTPTNRRKTMSNNEPSMSPVISAVLLVDESFEAQDALPLRVPSILAQLAVTES